MCRSNDLFSSRQRPKPMVELQNSTEEPTSQLRNTLDALNQRQEELQEFTGGTIFRRELAIFLNPAAVSLLENNGLDFEGGIELNDLMREVNQLVGGLIDATLDEDTINSLSY